MKLTSTSRASTDSDPDYAAFETLIGGRIAGVTGPLFTTTASGLWEAYLAGIPEASRQHYTCRCCQRFIERYGGLVKIEHDGSMYPWLWIVPEAGTADFFRESMARIQQHVFRSKVNGVFLSSDLLWGTPRTGEWTHLAGQNPKVFSHPLKSAAQIMAEKHEEYGLLRRGLAEYSLEALIQAVRVLEAGAVDRSEKSLEMAKWLLDLHRRMADARIPARDNLAWLAVATAPPGWCHFKSRMLGTLLQDIVAGLPFEVIRRKWNEKVDPTQYMRPDPEVVKEGNLKAANAIVAKLGSAGALQRRFARLSDVLAFVWKPRSPKPRREEDVTFLQCQVFEFRRLLQGAGSDPILGPQLRERLADAEEQLRSASKPQGGDFDHLRKATPKVQEVQLPAQSMTWEKFRDEVLPGALTVECLALAHGPYYGLVTAANPEAPPILQWDGLRGETEDAEAPTSYPLPRNPASLYVYVNGSTAAHWNLAPNFWVSVTAAFLLPHQWQRPDLFKHHGEAVLLSLRGAWDTGHVAGGGFFPESLRSEYHEIRAAMEAHAFAAPLAGKEEGDANGLVLNKKHAIRLRVKTAAVASQEYLVTA